VLQPDGTGQLTTYLGLTARVTDARGNVRVLQQDELGRVVASSSVDADGREITTRLAYGPFDTLHAVVDADGNTLTAEYDGLGRRVKLVDPDTGVQLTQYNAFGEVVEETQADGSRTSYTRDALGRPKKITTRDGDTILRWDDQARNFPSFMRSPDGVETKYSYDALKRPAQVAWNIDGVTYAIGSAYDSVGRLTRLVYPSTDGSAGLQVQYEYTPTGYLWRAGDPDMKRVYWTAEARNADGQLKRETFGNGLTTTRDYDVLGRAASIQTGAERQPARQSLAYDYDASGNLHHRIDAVAGTTEEFSYDTLDRLTGWDVRASSAAIQTLQYEYDHLGNIETRTVLRGPGTSAIYYYGRNGAGPHALTSAWFGETETNQVFNYNSVGNQVMGPGRTVDYTAFGLPSRIQETSSATSGRMHQTLLGRQSVASDIHFKYDGEHRRVLKHAANGDSTVYAGGLYEKRTTAAATTHVFYVMADGRPVAELARTADGSAGGERIVYVHDDHLGSTDVVSGESGRAIARYRFDPFGRLREDSLSDGSPASQDALVRLGFSGHETDGEFGLINMQGRIYDPAIGRFLTPDPLISNDLDGQSYNHYSYVLNNPLGSTDPTGFMSFPQPVGPPVVIVGPPGVIGETVVHGSTDIDMETGPEGIICVGSGCAGPTGPPSYPTPSYSTPTDQGSRNSKADDSPNAAHEVSQIAGRVAATVQATVESGIWSIADPTLRGAILHKVVQNTPHNNPGFDVDLGEKIQELKTISAQTKNIAAPVQKGAKQLKGVATTAAKEVTVVMSPGTGANKLAIARNALNRSTGAREAGVRVGSVRTGVPGAGQLVKVLAPVGTIVSAAEFYGNVREGDWQQAVGSGTAFTAGALETASLASPLVTGGLTSFPPVAGVIGAFSLGWTAGTWLNNHFVDPLLWGD
jgi:RHS repeat-associated protein